MLQIGMYAIFKLCRYVHSQMPQKKKLKYHRILRFEPNQQLTIFTFIFAIAAEKKKLSPSTFEWIKIHGIDTLTYT